MWNDAEVANRLGTHPVGDWLGLASAISRIVAKLRFAGDIQARWVLRMRSLEHKPSPSVSLPVLAMR